MASATTSLLGPRNRASKEREGRGAPGNARCQAATAASTLSCRSPGARMETRLSTALMPKPIPPEQSAHRRRRNAEGCGTLVPGATTGAQLLAGLEPSNPASHQLVARVLVWVVVEHRINPCLHGRVHSAHWVVG